MRSEENVAGRGLKKRETLLKAVHDLHMLGEAKSGSRNRRQTVGVDHLVTNVAFAGLPGPAGTARRVTGSHMRRERDRAELEGFAIVQLSNVFDGRNRRNHSVLRIVARDGAPCHHSGTPGAGIHACSTQTLQF